MSTVVGVVIMTRHGDRQGFYQNPLTYTASGTTITPLGEVQEYESGIGLKQRYLNASSGSSTVISGISWPSPKLSQLSVIADSSEGQVIVNSATALMQGMWPANSISNATLANGTNVVSPLGGFLYVPVETVEPEEDISLEGYSDCPAFTANNKAVYASDAFKARGAEAKDFLQSIAPIVGGRNVSFENMYNVFDYYNVEYIHNATFLASTNLQTMEMVRDLANYHEHAVFTDSELDGIGNIAGQTILGPILDGLNSITNATVGLKMKYIGVAYKPFLSLFNMTEVDNPNMVDYASVAVFEVHNSTAGELSVELHFRNGSATASDGSDIVATQMWGQNSVSLADFKSKLEPYAVTELGDWCNKCGNTETRGCDLIEIANSSTRTSSPTSTYGHQRTSPLVAGIIGAIIAFVLAAVAFLLLELYRNRKARRGRGVAGGKRRGVVGEGESAHELRTTDSTTSSAAHLGDSKATHQA